MQEPNTIHSTFVIERSYPVTPEQVFAAFSNAETKRRWFGESDHHDVSEFTLDFRAGGREYARYTFGPGTPFPGVTLENESMIQDILPNERIVSTATMSLGGRHISTSLVTIELLAKGTGTDLICTHQAAYYQGSGGPEMREQGWRTLFDRLEAELAR